MITRQERLEKKATEIKEHLLRGGLLEQLEFPDEAFEFMKRNADLFKDIRFTRVDA